MIRLSWSQILALADGWDRTINFACSEPETVWPSTLLSADERGHTAQWTRDSSLSRLCERCDPGPSWSSSILLSNDLEGKDLKHHGTLWDSHVACLLSSCSNLCAVLFGWRVRLPCFPAQVELIISCWSFQSNLNSQLIKIKVACPEQWEQWRGGSKVQENETPFWAYYFLIPAQRYLLSRSNNVEAAAKKLRETLAWRESYRPQDIKFKEIKDLASTGRLEVLDFRDLEGRPVLCYRLR